MKPILIIYATREGHTRRIAERAGAAIAAEGRTFEVVDAANLPNGFEVANYSAAVVAASVHKGKHESEMTQFVRCHTAWLRQVPTLFLSVSLEEVSAEKAGETAARRAEAQANVKQLMERFLLETNWRPTRAEPVAWALVYSKYNWLMRFIMKRIAKKAGGPTDTTRDYEFTDWTRLDRMVRELVHP